MSIRNFELDDIDEIVKLLECFSRWSLNGICNCNGRESTFLETVRFRRTKVFLVGNW